MKKLAINLIVTGLVLTTSIVSALAHCGGGAGW